MAKRNRQTGVNFEERFIDQLQKSQDRVLDAVEINTKETRAIKRRLRIIEAKVFPAQAQPAWYTNQKLLYLALGSVFIFLLILATVTHTKIPNF